ncbi:AbfB domain-containing protein [Streptomyces sp. WAC05374]|uniref:AbfB domain-containing protein n=1 Tax=Streptomyces sp. WAC05374 TaxID=2487420 RepID=UPI0037DD81BF
MQFWSVNFPDLFIRHRNFQGVTAQGDGPATDFAFHLVPGLSGPNGVFFRSVNFPDHFLRHRDAARGRAGA